MDFDIGLALALEVGPVFAAVVDFDLGLNFLASPITA